MTAGRTPRGLLVAAVLAVVAAAALWLPWWTAPRRPVVLAGTGPARPGEAASWSGWEIVGPLHGAALVVLALAGATAVAVGALRGGRWTGAARLLLVTAVAARPLLVAAGAAAAATGVAVLLDWGAGRAAGAAVAAAAGVGAAVLAVASRLRTAAPAGGGTALLLGAGVLAAVAAALPVGAPAGTARTAGPFVLVTGLDAPQLRSGTTGLAAFPEPRIVIVGDAVGTASEQGLAVVDHSGRADVLAYSPDRPVPGPSIVGVAGDRVLRWSTAEALTVTGLRPDDPVAVTVRGVAAVSALGPDGTAWLRATGDPSGTARRFSLGAYTGEQDIAATYLPVVTILDAPDSAPIDVAAVLPTRGAGVRFAQQEAGQRLERVTGAPTGRADVTALAGGLDPACGLTAAGQATFVPSPSPMATDRDGGIWFVAGRSGAVGVADDRLVRLGPDGELRAVDAPLPGAVSALVVDPAGAVVLAVRDAPALWRLPDPNTTLVDLPPPPTDCVSAPAAVGPPVGLAPVATTGRDLLGVPLGADGRWASGGRRGAAAEVIVVSPDGSRTPVGVRRDGAVGRVWPDGSGGAWWLESPAGEGTPDTLVHGTPDGDRRYPAVPDPAPPEGSTLVADLGGRPPLLGTVAGAFRIDAGSAVRVVDGPVDDGIVRADGRGWVLADGRLLALDRDRVLGPVIDAGERRTDPTPVAVQLAKGVPPAALALPRATVALDAGGRTVVIAGGVVLGVDDGGGVTVVAQDARLPSLELFAVEGGIVAADDGALLRVDLPAPST